MTIRGRGIAYAAAKAFPFPFSVPPARAHRPGSSTGADTARALPLRHPGPQGQGPVRPSRSMPPRIHQLEVVLHISLNTNLVAMLQIEVHDWELIRFLLHQWEE